jgi:zinc transporter ZupT
MTSDCALGLLSLLGIGFHSYLDGVTYAISSSVSTFTGALIALGMVVHEFAEGVVTYALLLRSGFPERRSFLLAFAAGDVSTPLGTLTSFAFVSHVRKPILGLLLSLSAGTLLRRRNAFSTRR